MERKIINGGASLYKMGEKRENDDYWSCLYIWNWLAIVDTGDGYNAAAAAAAAAPPSCWMVTLCWNLINMLMTFGARSYWNWMLTCVALHFLALIFPFLLEWTFESFSGAECAVPLLEKIEKLGDGILVFTSTAYFDAIKSLCSSFCWDKQAVGSLAPRTHPWFVHAVSAQIECGFAS